jgi:hypothetical protein
VGLKSREFSNAATLGQKCSVLIAGRVLDWVVTTEKNLSPCGLDVL